MVPLLSFDDTLQRSHPRSIPRPDPPPRAEGPRDRGRRPRRYQYPPARAQGPRTKAEAPPTSSAEGRRPEGPRPKAEALQRTYVFPAERPLTLQEDDTHGQSLSLSPALAQRMCAMCHYLYSRGRKKSAWLGRLSCNPCIHCANIPTG